MFTTEQRPLMGVEHLLTGCGKSEDWNVLTGFYGR
jgi:hypothetical protein